MKYRPEIDGLRAIAVLSVLIFHLEIVLFERIILKGGYLGVDIFFVISGYLITYIIVNETKNNSFSLLNFYERRARRILPILLFIILIFLPVFWLTLLPFELKEYAESGLYALSFLSNFYFYSNSIEYGAPESFELPLLHTWSLSVEEQFYLFSPAFFILIWKKFNNYIYFIIFLIALSSILFSSIMASINYEYNYYLVYSRIWEILVGSFIAIYEIKNGIKKDSKLYDACTIIGLSILILSLIFFDKNTKHPSYITILPIIGVALIIFCSSGKDIVGKILSNKILVFIGIISFSIYLWHFPIISFALSIFEDIGNIEKIYIILIIFLFSITSFYLIEKTFREKFTKKFFINFILISSISIICMLMYITISKNFINIWSTLNTKDSVQRLKIFDAIQHKIETLENKNCKFNINDYRDAIDTKFKKCRAKYGNATFILGDSHAMNLFNIFHFSNNFNFLVGITKGGCRPHDKCKNSQYDLFKNKISKLIKENDLIIFHQSGSYLVKDERGWNDSQFAFDSGIFSIDNKNIETVSSYLRSLNEKTKGSIFWLGPFIEYGYNIKNVLRGKVKNYSEINPNSFKIFEKLNASLLKYHQDNRNYKYIPFNQFYKVNKNAFIEVGSKKRCFQFRDRDHFTRCAQKQISSIAEFRIFK